MGKIDHMQANGAVAAGDTHTAQAAAEVLRAGGNAFDAVLAALMSACVAEPVLASLGGGGFLLARPESGAPQLYDFFAHTPLQHRGDVDLYPLMVDFGTVQQEFHIGMGSIATPGVVAGLFAAHRDLGSIPLSVISEPALKLAREGFALSPLQGYIFNVVAPIYQASDSCRQLFASPLDDTRLIGEGENMKNPAFADFLDVLCREGEDLFYKGEVAQRVATDSEAGGGHLGLDDFSSYRTRRRDPLNISYGDAQLLTNPPPSTGGTLIGFALKLLQDTGLGGERFGSVEHLKRIVHALELTHHARIETALGVNNDEGATQLLDPEFLEGYRSQILGRDKSYRGTTHISVIDAKGNAAALTVSNGEGSAYIAPGTGVVLNNMLGEEDINPNGLNQWTPNRRLSSMMAPCILFGPDGSEVALGSGGSNRIRTAILQVILAVLEFDVPLQDAVCLPRIHFEGGVLNVEPGFDPFDAAQLGTDIESFKVWEDLNLFFGGVHAVGFDARGRTFSGAGDPRRGGAFVMA